MQPRTHTTHGVGSMYFGAGIMAILSFAAMYLLMFAMMDRLNVVMNYNQVYMAALIAQRHRRESGARERAVANVPASGELTRANRP